MFKVEPHRAFLLHRRPYSETSLILEVFSSQFGRVSLLAKGARRKRSPWRGQIAPFAPLVVAWCGRSDLKTLILLEGAIGRQFKQLDMMCAFYVNELLMRLLEPYEPYPQLFERYQVLLDALPVDREPSLRLFEKHLLQAVGYGLGLSHDAKSGAKILANKRYAFIPGVGAFALTTPTTDNVPMFISGSSLIALNDEVLHNEAELKEIKQLMRLVLRTYIGEKPLKSRELMRSWEDYHA